MNTRQYDLVAFDVDGTLINSRDGRVVWQFLNQRFQVEPQADSRRFEAYLRKEITYAQWVDLDIGQWQEAGALQEQIVQEIRANLHLVRGARETVEELRCRGYRLVVISGTLDITLKLLFPEHPFEEVFTNKINFDGQGHISRWEATPYDMDGKQDALLALSSKMDVPLSRTVYVGDNFNDISIMKKAGFAVAFEPKVEELHEVADAVIRDDLRHLLELLP